MANSCYSGDEAERPSSSSLPPGDGVVILDERPPVEGDGLGLSGGLLVDGCKEKRFGG